jgi:hypothetical protein
VCQHCSFLSTRRAVFSIATNCVTNESVAVKWHLEESVEPRRDITALYDEAGIATATYCMAGVRFPAGHRFFLYSSATRPASGFLEFPVGKAARAMRLATHCYSPYVLSTGTALPFFISVSLLYIHIYTSPLSPACVFYLLSVLFFFYSSS